MDTITRYKEETALPVRINDPLHVVKRRLWWIVAPTLACVLLGFFAWRFLPYEYAATSTVVIEPEAEAITGTSAFSENFLQPSVVETQVRIIGSPLFAEQVMEKLGLFDDREFVGKPRKWARIFGLTLDRILGQAETPQMAGASQREGSELTVAEVRDDDPDSWGNDAAAELETERAYRKLRAGMPDGEALGSRAASAENFLEHLKVEQVGRSNVINVTFTSRSPEKAAHITNTLVNLYLNDQTTRRRTALEEKKDWAARQLDQLHEEQRRTSETVVDFNVAHRVVTAGGSSLKDQELTALNKELIAVELHKNEINARLTQIRQLRQANKDVSGFADILASPLIMELRQQEALLRRQQAENSEVYGKMHPQTISVNSALAGLKEKINQEVVRIEQKLESDLSVAIAQLNTLSGKTNALAAAALEQQKFEVGLDELKRNADAARSLYNQVMMTSSKAIEKEASLQPEVRVISYAYVTDQRSWPPSLVVMLGVPFTAGLLLSTIFVFIIEARDETVRTDEQIERHHQVPCTSIVPETPVLRNYAHVCEYLLRHPGSAYAESLRSVYSAVNVAANADRATTVLISSAIPDEGKNTVAAGLATIMADFGKKVLLVDMDLRQSDLWKMFEVPNDRDFTDFLQGRITSDDLIAHTSAGFDVVVTNKKQTNPLAIFASSKFQLLLDGLCRKYDYIVLNSPPLLGFSDVVVLSDWADQVMLLVRWGKTPSHALSSALQILARNRDKVTGIILSRVDLRKYKYYRGGRSMAYYDKFKKYYAVSDPEPVPHRPGETAVRQMRVAR